MKHVLIIVQNLPVPFDRRVWQEAKALQANGYRVSVICPKGENYPASHEVLDGIHIYRHSLPIEAAGAAGYFLEYGWSLACEFRLACKIYFLHRFDAIHACNPPDTLFLIGGFFKLLFGTKFLFDHHDINPELYEAKFGRRDIFYTLMLLCEKLTFKTADISIATNESYKRIAVTRGKIPAEKVFVVRSGPDPERMKAALPVPALKHGKKYLIGYLGTMGDQEGIEYLLEAARHIVHDQKRSDVHFTLIGSGPALNKLKAVAEEKNLSGVVNFTGRIPDTEMLTILSAADICVNPDEVNAMNDKSTMNKIMEYMSLGKPIVQFDVTEGKVSAGDASLYARANDARNFAEKIITLLDNSALRKQMGKAGRKRIETTLAWKYEIPRLLAAYEALFAAPSFHNKLRWHFHRLAAMKPREILHRIQEKIKREKDQFFPPIKPSPSGRGSNEELPFLPGLRERLAAWDIPEDIISEWEALRAQAQSGRFFLLGKHWPFCAPGNRWHLDPVTGNLWPRDTYCFDINYRHAANYGDAKYVWELNRLQYLQPLAALACEQKDGELARFCLNEIESWIDHNPPYKGINWASGIELAIRTVSILVVTTFAGEYATDVQRAKILSILAVHGIWLARYPSLYSSANNHLAAEGLGLFLTGMLCPCLPSSGQWQRQGWKLLCNSAQALVLPDGAGAEQAMGYAAFTLEMLMLGLYVAQAASMEIPACYTNRIRAGGEFLRWFMDAGGNVPRIGDDDNARVVGCYSYNENYISSVLGCVATITGCPDSTPPAYTYSFRNMLFGFPPPGAASPQGVRTFSDGGYTVGRHLFQGKEILLAMDHGNLGYLSIAAHGHADALSIWLHISGQPVLADAGTCLYHSGGKWRDYFRGTEAHNTLCVEKTSSSIMASHFNWSHKAKCALITSESGKDGWRITAEHDGYRKRFGAVHRRTLAVTPDKGFRVEDMLVSNQTRHVETGFLLHPSLTAEINGERITVKNGRQIILSVSHTGPLAPSLAQAWYSPCFGEKEATIRIVFSGLLAPQQKAVTVFEFS